MNGHLTSIIDWGDAEIIQPYRDMLGCDKTLLRVFLDACDWWVGKGLPRKALSLALYREAVGFAEHRRTGIDGSVYAMGICARVTVQ